MPKKKVVQNKEQSNLEDFVVLGHLIKYNLYLLAKSVVFSAVVQKCKSVDEAIDVANRAIAELDLDSRRRAEAAKAQE
jgi:hypothetical protein